MTRKLALCTLVVALVVATNANECRVTNESLRTGCRLILTSNRTCFFRRSVKRDQRVTVVVDDLIAASRRNAKNGGKCKRGRWLKIQHESPLKINSSRTLCNRETMTATYGEGNLLILSRLAKQDCFKLTLTFAKNPRRSSFRCRRSAGASPPTFDVDNCGRYNTSRHVRDRVPWTVQLRILNDANPVCVGSLVNDRWVVTAAHCFDNIPAKNCHVHVPGNRRNFSIVTAAIHRRYGVSGVEHDIALIELDRPVSLDANGNGVSAICLPTRDVRVGELAYFSDQSAIAHEVSVETTHACEAVRQEYDTLSDTNLSGMTCVNGSVNGCHGDSGGSLIVSMGDGSDRHALAGVVSVGDRDCSSSKPAVYVNVYRHLDWIHQVLSYRLCYG
ncbi:trypsin-like [Oscarella lobularis]|uniref:trypsin-like n=1 Tax=Oscarella lobularis TaxID=121494 RepID=UPI003313E24A